MLLGAACAAAAQHTLMPGAHPAAEQQSGLCVWPTSRAAPDACCCRDEEGIQNIPAKTNSLPSTWLLLLPIGVCLLLGQMGLLLCCATYGVSGGAGNEPAVRFSASRA